MDLDAGSSSARRRRLSSPFSAHITLLSFLCSGFFLDLFEGLGCLVSTVVEFCARHCRTQAFWILFLTSNPLPLLTSLLDSDLIKASCVCGTPQSTWKSDLNPRHHTQGRCFVAPTHHPPRLLMVSTVRGTPPLFLRPDLKARSSTPVSMSTSICGVFLCYPGYKSVLSPTFLVVCSRYLLYPILCDSCLKSNRPTCVCGVPCSTWRQDPKDQRSFVSPSSWRPTPSASKPTWPASIVYDACSHQATICICVSLCCSLVSKPIEISVCVSLSVKHRRVESEIKAFLFGAIIGFNPKISSKDHQQCPFPTRASTTISFLVRNLLKLEDCSPLAIFLRNMASQISSCRGHERSFIPCLLFLEVNLSTKTPLRERYPSLGHMAKEYSRYPNRLFSCVMVRLGPEDTTRLILMRLEVVEHSTSRYTVTISKSENFEGCRFFSLRLSASGSFESISDTLSNLSKFVSLSLYCFTFELFKKKARRIFDVASIYVIT